MKTLIVTISILMLAFTTNASEPQETTEPPPRKFFEGAEIFEGKKNPQDMPTYVLMRSFMRTITRPIITEYDPQIRQNLFRKTGLEQSSIDKLIYLAELALKEDERMTKATVVCDYMKATGKSATKAGLAKIINDHEWAMRHIFTDIYDRLEYHISPDEADKLKHYLKETFVLGLHHVRKDTQPDEINLKRQAKHCKRIEDKQEAQNE